MKILSLIVISAVLGTVFSALMLAANPNIYLSLSDSVNWRIGALTVRQQHLETTLRVIHLRGESLIDGQSTLLLGDSHLHSFPTSLLEGPVANYSIAGETAERLAERLPHYKSVGRAKQIVLLTGRNDLAQGKSPQAVTLFVKGVLDQIPITTPVVVVGIPPLRQANDANESTRATNRLLENLCLKRVRCLFLDTQKLGGDNGSLREDYAIADGIHLSAAGYKELAIMLNHALRLLAQSKPGTVQ